MPKRGQAQSKNHPWVRRMTAEVSEAERRRKLSARTTKVHKVWTCPRCGSKRCEFEECASS